ncbi:MAG: hypothetical protein ACRD6W_02940, partial [Nitrososphaerales archaeon]
MATLSRARTLGGIGAVLVLIPFVSVVGYVLIIVSVRDISRALQDRAIFRNMVVAAGSGMVGALAVGYAILEANVSSNLNPSLYA